MTVETDYYGRVYYAEKNGEKFYDVKVMADMMREIDAHMKRMSKAQLSQLAYDYGKRLAEERKANNEAIN